MTREDREKFNKAFKNYCSNVKINFTGSNFTLDNIANEFDVKSYKLEGWQHYTKWDPKEGRNKWALDGNKYIWRSIKIYINATPKHGNYIKDFVFYSLEDAFEECAKYDNIIYNDVEYKENIKFDVVQTYNKEAGRHEYYLRPASFQFVLYKALEKPMTYDEINQMFIDHKITTDTYTDPKIGGYCNIGKYLHPSYDK